MIHKFRHHYYPELQSLHEQCNWLRVNLGLDAKNRAQDLQPNELRLVQFASLLANVIQQVEMFLANPPSLLADISGAAELERTILQGILPVKQKLTSRLKEVRSHTRPASGPLATGAAPTAPSRPGSGSSGVKSTSSGYTSGGSTSSSTSDCTNNSSSTSNNSSSSRSSSSEASGPRQSGSKPESPAPAQESAVASSAAATEGAVGAWSRMRAEKEAEAVRQAEDAAFVALSSSLQTSQTQTLQSAHHWPVPGSTSNSNSSSSSGGSGSTSGSGSTNFSTRSSSSSSGSNSNIGSSSAGTSPLVIADSFSPFDDDALTIDPSLCSIAPHGDAPLFPWEDASIMHATDALDWDASLAVSFAASVGDGATATRLRQPPRVSVASSSSSGNLLKRRAPPSSSDFSYPLTGTHPNVQSGSAAGGDAPAALPEGEEFLSQRRRRRLNTIVPNPRRPREAEFVCSSCNEGYRATTTDNPWWSCARQECPKCLCMQVPRFDINNSANGLEHDPNSQALFGDGVEDSGEDGNAEEEGEGEEDGGDAMGGDAAAGTAGACAFGGEGRLSAAEASQLLVLMCHARGCSGQHESEGHASVCRSVKLLMLHLRDCPVAPAAVPSSSSSASASSSSSSSASCSAPSSSSSCFNHKNNNNNNAPSPCLYPWCGPGKRFLDHLTHCYDGPACGVCRPTDEALPATLAALRACNVCR